MTHSIRTPLKKISGLGAVHEGAGHFWMQRLTALASLILVVLLLGIFINLSIADYHAVKQAFSNPVIALLMALLVISGVIHMRLGMKVVIEDYVNGKGARIIAIVFNDFFAILIGVASLLAVLKLSLGG